MNTWKKNTGIKRLWLALSYTYQGLKSAYRLEAAFRQEVWLVAPAIVLALFLPLSIGWRVALIASVLLVLVVELLNSAIEAVVDRVSTELHPLSKNAKDYGSAAVFLTLAMAALVWLAALAKVCGLLVSL